MRQNIPQWQNYKMLNDNAASRQRRNMTSALKSDIAPQLSINKTIDNTYLNVFYEIR